MTIQSLRLPEQKISEMKVPMIRPRYRSLGKLVRRFFQDGAGRGDKFNKKKLTPESVASTSRMQSARV
jgi:hypothetical protein